MKKNNLLLVAVFLSGCVLGFFVLQLWVLRAAPAQPPVAGRAPQPMAAGGLLSADDLARAALPEDTALAQPAPEVKRAADLPSQLVHSELPDGVVLGTPVPAEQTPAGEKPSGVVLSDGQNTVVLRSQRPAQRAADGSAITLIEAPVSLRRIQTLGEYKAFKRTARGSYPAADFTREEVLVLESQSNLPDNMFEIVSADVEGGVLKLRYRVNVFGLGEKVNTHSALKVGKISKPVVLEQVL